MAVIKNITLDTLAIGRIESPPVYPDDAVTISDAAFVGRAWPKSTWDLIEEPAAPGFADASTDEAWLWAATNFDPAAHSAAEVIAYLEQADDAERTRVLEAEAAGKARKTITEWSA